MPIPWTVVKVGGSLYDLPDLRQRLTKWIAQQTPSKILLVPGGGPTADVIREFDHIHQLGEETSHWLAIRAMSVNARFLQALLPGSRIVCEDSALRLAHAAGSEVALLDSLPFFVDDEARAGHLPHRWEVTSDSLAVRVATRFDAIELVFLKSVDWVGADWNEAAQSGIVDGYFPQALQGAPRNLPVRLVNLRK